MDKLVTLTLTDSECLSLRFALNAHAMEWGEKASAARDAGNDVDAATCERVRADYHRLWEMVNEAQEANGRVHDWLYRRDGAALDAQRRCERLGVRFDDDPPAHDSRKARETGDIDRWGDAMGIERLKGW